MDPRQERAAALLLANRAMLFSYIAAIVRDPQMVEDVFQNVALVILDKGDVAASVKDFPPWARRVARLEALAALRRRRKAPGPLDPSLLESLEADWAAADATAEPSATLQVCLERLSPYVHRLIELRYADGLPALEVARRLNRSPNTVYVALSRAYKSLAECVRRRLGREGANDE